MQFPTLSNAHVGLSANSFFYSLTPAKLLSDVNENVLNNIKLQDFSAF